MRHTHGELGTLSKPGTPFTIELALFVIVITESQFTDT